MLLAVAFALALALLLALPGRGEPHDIPNSITIIAFVKSEAEPRVLRVIVRVPLQAMRDINFPVHGPGYLDTDRVQPLLRDAAKVWIAGDLQLYEEGAALPPPTIVAARVSLPSDRSFSSYDRALMHVRGGGAAASISTGTELLWKQAMLDVLLEYPISSATSRFSIDPSLARLGVRTTTVLRFVTAGGAERDFEYVGSPGLVRLDPRWYQATARFVILGFDHILDGIDHLLFVFCLVIPFRRVRPLIAIITSFTVAHSITLVASAAGLAPDALWFPPLIEVLIALSIVYMALENIVGARLERRWLIAFGFGLVHGFGFSFALRQSLQFAGSHVATSLLSFNIGVELGQLFVLALIVPALAWLFRHLDERVGTIILSAFVAHTAWHWMIDRWAVFAQYRLTPPVIDAALAVAALRAGMLLLIVGGAGWAMYELYGRLMRHDVALSAAGTEASAE